MKFEQKDDLVGETEKIPAPSGNRTPDNSDRSPISWLQLPLYLLQPKIPKEAKFFCSFEFFDVTKSRKKQKKKFAKY